MEIREAVLSDLEPLMAFYNRMNEVINTRTEKFDPNNPSFPSREMVSDAIANHGQFIGVVNEPDEETVNKPDSGEKIVIACIVNHKCTDAYKTVKWQVNAADDEFWILHALRVLPEYEGRGYAKKMLEHLIELAPKRGQKAIRLDVLEGYTVEKLYIPFGFTYIDTIEINYEDIGHPERFRLLEKVIGN